MKSEIYITIKNQGRHSTYPYRFELRKKGFEFKKTGKYTGVWKLKAKNSADVDEIKRFAQRAKLSCIIEYPEERRSSDYRRNFFTVNKGLLNKGRYYHCAYCGRIFKKENITVDHLFSIKGIQKDSVTARLNKKILSKLDIQNINDPPNLVPACQRCNSRKGSKGGLWILRGIVGKYPLIWVFRWVLRAFLFCVCCYFVIQFLS